MAETVRRPHPTSAGAKGNPTPSSVRSQPSISTEQALSFSIGAKYGTVSASQPGLVADHFYNLGYASKLPTQTRKLLRAFSTQLAPKPPCSQSLLEL